MESIRVDGNDPDEMYCAARDAIARARSGQGPTLVEAMTFRFKGHLLGDVDGYMNVKEKEAAVAADPVPRFRKRLIADGIATEAQLSQIEADAEREILDAIEFALASKWPEHNEIRKDVYADEVPT